MVNARNHSIDALEDQRTFPRAEDPRQSPG
jgi:hypothetical protein